MVLLDFINQIKLNDCVEYLRNELNCTDEMSSAEQFDMYSFFINELKKIEPVENKDNYILIGYFVKDYFSDDDKASIIASVSAYKKDEIMNQKNSIIEEANEIIPNSKLKKEIKRLYATYIKDQSFIDSYAFDITPWASVLNYEVDKENIERIGHAAFGAVILEELSFNGIIEEDHQERIDELMARADEVHELFKLPEEEREKHFVSAEVVFEDLFEDMDQEELEKLEQKKLKEIKDLKYEKIALFNRHAIATELKNVMGW